MPVHRFGSLTRFGTAHIIRGEHTFSASGMATGSRLRLSAQPYIGRRQGEQAKCRAVRVLEGSGHAQRRLGIRRPLPLGREKRSGDNRPEGNRQKYPAKHQASIGWNSLGTRGGEGGRPIACTLGIFLTMNRPSESLCQAMGCCFSRLSPASVRLHPARSRSPGTLRTRPITVPETRAGSSALHRRPVQRPAPAAPAILSPGVAERQKTYFWCHSRWACEGARAASLGRRASRPASDRNHSSTPTRPASRFETRMR